MQAKDPRRTPRGTVIGFIAVTILGMFAGIWGWILWQTITVPNAAISNEFVVAAGTLSTLLASLTSASIGSAIAEVKTSTEQRVDAASNKMTYDEASVQNYQAVVVSARAPINVSDVTGELSWRVKAAIFTYLAVGIAVLSVWLTFDSSAPEVVASFALSIVGWLVGAGGIVFESPPPAAVETSLTSGSRTASEMTPKKRSWRRAR